MKLSKKIAAAAASAMLAVTSVPAASFTSNAADHNYLEALAMSLYFFDSNACGSGITDGPLTWRGDCHTYDAQASVGSLGGSEKAAVDPDGDGKVDVSGGWHDAGDHIKFNLTIGFGLSCLGMSDYFSPGIYDKANCRDHLEYEMRWGADYLMKTTFLDGSGNVAAVAHVVADGGTDHSFWTSPEVQTYDRPVFWLTASSNNSSVCCEMACGLAAAAYVLKESDPEYAAECIKYSKALLKFAQEHVGNDTGGIGGFYGTDSQYQDEEALAQAWLWILGEGSKPTRVPQNKDYGGSQYDGWVFSWDKVWQGYASMMYKATKDSVFKDELIVELNGQNGLKVGTYNTNGWGTSRINCALQMDAYTIADGDPNSEYAKGAKWQLDYILGDNNLNYSFLLGFGDKWPTHIHHRAANPGENGETSAANPSAKYTNYGMLVGGIDGGGYEDHADRYQYTEGALDYNGCFAIACAYAASLYGGDGTTFDAIKKNAAEINDSFVFRKGGGNPGSYERSYELIIDDMKTTYNIGEELDLTGGKLSVRTVSGANSDEFTVDLDDSDIRIECDPFDKAGSYSVDVYYMDIEVPVAKFTVSVTEPEIIKTEYRITPPTKTAYKLGEPLDYEGCSVKITDTYSTGEVKETILSVEDGGIMITSPVIDRAGEFVCDVALVATGNSVGKFSITVTDDSSEAVKVVYGDANCDGRVSIADATAILQHMANQDKYGLSVQGEMNGDVAAPRGITGIDAVTIQMVDAGMLSLSDLPVNENDG